MNTAHVIDGARRQSGSVACLILAHNDPVHLRRLRDALDPFPVFVHVDRRSDAEQFAAMTAGLPAGSVVRPRRASAWGAFEIVAAELDSYRQVLANSDAEHLIVMSGADYPLRTSADIGAYLASVGGRSVARVWPLPFPAWGRSGGLARLRYRHWAWRKHMVRLPVPRRLPDGVQPSGASVWKILARRHVQALVDVVDSRPDLIPFWRRTWCADETLIPTLLRSPITAIDWENESVSGEAWWIGWDGTRRKSPPWLTTDHLPVLRAASTQADGRAVPALFARKVSTSTSAALLDRIDTELRRPGGAAILEPPTAARQPGRSGAVSR